MADSSSDATFVDVPASNPNFKYIQGLANAGLVVGIDAKHFAPSRLLTREEMIAIKVPIDVGGAADPVYGRGAMKFSDYPKINQRYYAAVGQDAGYSTYSNIGRVWGTIKTFQPQKQATRAEVAIAISSFGPPNDAADAVAHMATAAK